MCELVDKLVDHSIDTNRSACELQLSICRVLEYEVVSIEVCELGSTNTSSQLQDYMSAQHGYRPSSLTVGMWFTYGSCTIVLIVCSTDLSANS